MSTKKEVYIAIRDRVLDKTDVLTSRLFNSQVDNLNEENSFNFPAAFIEFLQLEYITKARGLQEAQAIIRIRVSYDSLQTEDLDVMDLIDSVHSCLQGYAPTEAATPLNRIFEQMDSNHDVIQTWVLDYETLILDDSGRTDKNLVPAELDEICIDASAQKPRLKEL